MGFALSEHSHRMVALAWRAVNGTVRAVLFVNKKLSIYSQNVDVRSNTQEEHRLFRAASVKQLDFQGVVTGPRGF